MKRQSMIMTGRLAVRRADIGKATFLRQLMKVDLWFTMEVKPYKREQLLIASCELANG